MLPLNKKDETKYKAFYDQYHWYMRSTTQKRYTNIFIPKNTEMLVWYEMWQFNDDMTDLQDMWKKGEKTFYLPNGIRRYDCHISNKDVTIPMALVSYRNEKDIPDSRIITELYGDVWPSRADITVGQIDYEPYGLWVKMYEQPYYIPELGTTIVAYGVYEEHLPKVSECFKYGNMKHGVGNLTYKNSTGWNINSTAAHGTGGGTVRPDPLSTKGQSILNQYIQNIQNNPTMKWTCQICGMDTTYVEYDYLGSGTNHLACELKDTMNNMFGLEN